MKKTWAGILFLMLTLSVGAARAYALCSLGGLDNGPDCYCDSVSGLCCDSTLDANCCDEVEGNPECPSEEAPSPTDECNNGDPTCASSVLTSNIDPTSGLLTFTDKLAYTAPPANNNFGCAADAGCTSITYSGNNVAWQGTHDPNQYTFSSTWVTPPAMMVFSANPCLGTGGTPDGLGHCLFTISTTANPCQPSSSSSSSSSPGLGFLGGSSAPVCQNTAAIGPCASNGDSCPTSLCQTTQTCVNACTVGSTSINPWSL